MKKLLAILLVCFLVCTALFACGKTNDAVAEKGEAMLEDVTDGDAGDTGALMDSVESASTTVAPSQKLIRKVWLEAETENMDPLLSGINQKVLDLGGYVDSRNVYNGSQ